MWRCTPTLFGPALAGICLGLGLGAAGCDQLQPGATSDAGPPVSDGGGRPAMLGPPADLAAPAEPPSTAWLSSGGGSATSAAGASLDVSLCGGAGSPVELTAPGGESLRPGLLSIELP